VKTRICVSFVLAFAVAAGTALSIAQTPQGAPPSGAAAAAQPDGGTRQGAGQQPGAPGQRGRGGRGEGGFTGPPAEPAKLLFREVWAQEMAQPMVQASLSNANLSLHLYGNPDEIRKTSHPTEDYTYTGETTTNWAITLSDSKSYWNLTGDARIRLKTRNSGFRTTHVVIKTADGKYFASEEGNPESSAWIERDYIFRDLTWRALLMTDTPTNASNRRQPNPKRVPIIPTTRSTPDLAKVEEVGFSDLAEGGWIPATSRVQSWEVWGKALAR
jgi:hypothetical protein